MKNIKSTAELPEGYKPIYSVDLRKNKKAALTVNIMAIIITAILIIPMLFLMPISGLFDMSAGFPAYILRFAALLLFQLAYLILHELVHGIAMKICGTKKVNYGLTGMYAFAGSSDYYRKRAYIFIALAPVIFWGIVLAVITPIVPATWFWAVYLVQVTNLSGAAGDMFVTARFSRLPGDILVRDSGVSMTVYSKK